MTDKTPDLNEQRRDFLRGTSVAGVGAALALNGVSTVSADSQMPSATSPKDEGYRLTQHILDYYKSAAS
jgi:hypothetical protein